MAAYETQVQDRDVPHVRRALLKEIARDESDASDLIAFARAILKETGDAGNSLRKFISPINDVCSMSEKEGFLGALEAVARTREEPSDVQLQFLQSVRRLLLGA